ncbi:hypothetical protein FB451DRAFT_1407557 [Mycena latifolia]|nr:hypothetical protein FB451DRAFT_1407557 [Mycena latifolia]
MLPQQGTAGSRAAAGAQALGRGPWPAVETPLLLPVPILVGILGPTPLPLTHAPGAVEWSIRHIVLLETPMPYVHRNNRAYIVGAEAVEHGLVARMHRAVLALWFDWGTDPELTLPRLLPKSSLDAATTLSVGMGLGGTWV